MGRTTKAGIDTSDQENEMQFNMCRRCEKDFDDCKCKTESDPFVEDVELEPSDDGNESDAFDTPIDVE